MTSTRLVPAAVLQKLYPCQNLKIEDAKIVPMLQIKEKIDDAKFVNLREQFSQAQVLIIFSSVKINILGTSNSSWLRSSDIPRVQLHCSCTNFVTAEIVTMCKNTEVILCQTNCSQQ